uniref:Uncharacterized protein n=1 Tax=Branchiostoma floridae TaxID=7739 RepID=C3YTC5_BRAFL|eukprot:XP_002600480.1 hypothetical protein BRAFLDRAFT_70144 [Branchiostoma floridae]
MSEGQQQSQTGDTEGATPMQQDQTDWTSLADAAASIPNPMYTSEAGATPKQQDQTDWQAHADATANVPNPMYASETGATPLPQDQTDWKSLADIAASIPNPMYISRAVQMVTLSDDVEKLTARTELRMTELEPKTLFDYGRKCLDDATGSDRAIRVFGREGEPDKRRWICRISWASGPTRTTRATRASWREGAGWPCCYRASWTSRASWTEGADRASRTQGEGW